MSNLNWEDAKATKSISPKASAWTARGLRVTSRTMLLAGMLAAVGTASLRAQETMPDSQVEANVLKALAGAPDLASQSITTNTVYGVVTLSGNVPDEAARTKAENLAANSAGVKKVVDELQVGAAGSVSGTDTGTPGPGMVLQSDGTYAPAQGVDQAGSAAAGTAPASGAVMNDPDHDQAQYGTPNGGVSNGQTGANVAPSAPQAIPQQPGAYPSQNPYPQTSYPQNRYPQTGSGQNGYPPQGGYPSNGYPQGRYPANGSSQNGYSQEGGVQPYGGQVAGAPVVVPVGTLVRVRVNRLLASDRLQPGDAFSGLVANDVTAGGFVAIPRGAGVRGVVVSSKSSGAISGRGELSLQLTSLEMGGKVYPLQTDIWARQGPDKTGNTVGDAAGLGIAGALIGAIAGRGAGAAIGAGIGAGAGVAASAASPRGQVVVPPEGMVSFNLAQPANVSAVSEAEMQRLAYGIPNGQPQRRPMYARPYPGYYQPYPPPPPSGYPPY